MLYFHYHTNKWVLDNSLKRSLLLDPGPVPREEGPGCGQCCSEERDEISHIAGGKKKTVSNSTFKFPLGNIFFACLLCLKLFSYLDLKYSFQ